MQYDPKLKKAMEEMKAILKKYDIAAVIILHRPGFSEFLNEITPSYSCAHFHGNESVSGIRFKTHGRTKEDVAATVNMFDHFAMRSAKNAMVYIETFEQLKAITGAESTGDNTTSHTQQNN